MSDLLAFWRDSFTKLLPAAARTFAVVSAALFLGICLETASSAMQIAINLAVAVFGSFLLFYLVPSVAFSLWALRTSRIVGQTAAEFAKSDRYASTMSFVLKLFHLDLS